MPRAVPKRPRSSRRTAAQRRPVHPAEPPPTGREPPPNGEHARRRDGGALGVAADDAAAVGGQVYPTVDARIAGDGGAGPGVLVLVVVDAYPLAAGVVRAEDAT